MLLYIIRHGEPDYVTDTLTETGIIQAQLLSERLSSVKFDRIFSSPLGRAKQTAMPTCVKQNIDFEVLPWLSESLAFDAMSAEIDGKKEWWFSIQNTKFRTTEGAQKYATAKTESFCDSTASSYDSLLSELGYEKDGCGYKIKNNKYNRVAFFCHGGISNVLLSYALMIPFNIFCASFLIPYTGVAVLDFALTDDKFTAPKCLMFSDLSHLYNTRLKNIYNNSFDI
ncbi:MAG: histidine phosphatase family protein [Treponema sp.]|nr:histidine phosphatase family protein [Treponema sp.]